jgi:hypothetical protein
MELKGGGSEGGQTRGWGDGVKNCKRTVCFTSSCNDRVFGETIRYQIFNHFAKYSIKCLHKRQDFR